MRVIYTAEEFHLVQAGEVSVCPFTTHTWTVLFPLAAALVTDSGGALSHVAVVARSMGCRQLWAQSMERSSCTMGSWSGLFLGVQDSITLFSFYKDGDVSIWALRKENAQ